MSQIIPLEIIANQSLTIRLSNSRYEFKIQTLSDDLMCITIIRDGITLVQSKRLMPYTYLLPKHLSLEYGNFAFVTPDDEYPYYTSFQSDHTFYYIPNDEVEG